MQILSGLADTTGIGGQNRDNPASLFGNHQFVTLTVDDGMGGMEERWFDPSYGIEYTGGTRSEKLASVDAAVAGYLTYQSVRLIESNIGTTGADVNGDGVLSTIDWNVYAARKNPQGTQMAFQGESYPEYFQ